LQCNDFVVKEFVSVQIQKFRVRLEIMCKCDYLIIFYYLNE
jgi:hypothetical protein